MSDDLIPIGTYRAKPTVSGFITTKNGYPQFVIECEIVDGDHAGSRIAKYSGIANDEAMEWTLRDLRNCGWTGTDVMAANVDPNVEVRIKVEHETYEGKTRAKLKSIFSNDGGGGALAIKTQAMDEAKKREIGARMNALLKHLDASGGTSKPKPAARPAAARSNGNSMPSDDSDDGIPF
jgi:hypothetical protein